MSSFDQIFRHHRIMAVLRGLPEQETVTVAHQAWDLGVELLEVPIGQADQVPALAAAVAAGRERGKIVGAGTVITPEQVQAARDAGAGYTVAPGLAPRILSASIATGLPHLPGVATPSEVQHAQQLGCQWVKVFPASTLGPGWFQAIRGPFPNMRYVATGGISAAQAPDYLEAGADLIALGSAILNPDQHDQVAAILRQYEHTTAR